MERDNKDPLGKALERLRENPDFRLVVGDLVAKREQEFSLLASTSDANRQQQLVGSIQTLHDLATMLGG